MRTPFSQNIHLQTGAQKTANPPIPPTDRRASLHSTVRGMMGRGMAK